MPIMKHFPDQIIPLVTTNIEDKPHIYDASCVKIILFIGQKTYPCLMILCILPGQGGAFSHTEGKGTSLFLKHMKTHTFAPKKSVFHVQSRHVLTFERVRNNC